MNSYAREISQRWILINCNITKVKFLKNLMFRNVCCVGILHPDAALHDHTCFWKKMFDLAPALLAKLWWVTTHVKKVTDAFCMCKQKIWDFFGALAPEKSPPGARARCPGPAQARAAKINTQNDAPACSAPCVQFIGRSDHNLSQKTHLSASLFTQKT